MKYSILKKFILSLVLVFVAISLSSCLEAPVDIFSPYYGYETGPLYQDDDNVVIPVYPDEDDSDEKPTLGKPVASVTGKFLSWGQVENATNYEIYSGSSLLDTVTTLKINLESYSSFGYGTYSLKVIAKAQGYNDSVASDSVTFIKTDFTDLSVRSYTGQNGVVAAASPFAAKAGLDILEAGGNAFDAAVAVSFALGVTEPNASGLGGGGFMVAYDAAKKEYVGYNFREFYPGNGSIENIPDGATTATKTGNVYSIGVPTQVAGLLSIEEDLGRLTLSDVITPAINYAENGFMVTTSLAKQIEENFDKIIYGLDDAAFEIFSSDGFEPMSEGDTLIQKDYAESLKLIKEQGLDGFYKGKTAEAILNAVGEKSPRKGLMTQADLDYAAANYPVKFDPVVGNYHGYTVVSANVPSSGGVVLIEALNMLESYFGQSGLRQLQHNSPEYINACATALWLSYGDRDKYVADYNNDPDLTDVISGLTNPEYAAARYREVYKPGKAYYNDIAYGDPSSYVDTSALMKYTSDDDNLGHYSTTTFSVADKEGNIVTFTQTINLFFGCGIVPEGTGFFMNNQCADLSLDETSVHFVKPYKQPVSSMMPTIVLDPNNKPWATLGSPGSNRIPSAVMQVILNCIEFDMGIQEAIDAARFYYYPDHDNAYLELEITDSISSATAEQLRSFGFNIPNTYTAIDEHFGGVQGIKFNSDGTLTGGADPRRDGKALGY